MVVGLTVSDAVELLVVGTTLDDAIGVLVGRLVMVGVVVGALLVVLRVGLAVVSVVFVPPKQYNPFL
jgi:hypothetical protein